MPTRSQQVWLLTAFAAAATVAVLVTVTLKRRARAGAQQTRVVRGADGGACDVPAEIGLRPNASADAPPVLFVGEGDVKLTLDGEGVYAPADSPRHIAPGEHTLKVETTGAQALSTKVPLGALTPTQPLTTQIRIDAFTPALFHAQAFPELGVTLVRAGAVCISCASPLNDVDLTFVKQPVKPTALLAVAAEALRSDDWTRAAHALRGVPPTHRKNAPFLRLAAAVHAASLQPDVAARELAALPKAEAGELPALLTALEALRTAEVTRRHDVLLARWNKLTERFGALTRRFEADAPGAVASNSSRFQELSRGFEEATRQKVLAREDELVTAAEATLVTLVAQLRKARPDDCAFQTEVVTTALR